MNLDNINLKGLFENKIKDNWTGEYCHKHPMVKVYQCNEKIACNEKMGIGNDKDDNIIYRDVCDIKDFCHQGKRCGKCDIEYLSNKSYEYQNWWQTVGRQEAFKRYEAKKLKEIQEDSKFKRKQIDYKN